MEDAPICKILEFKNQKLENQEKWWSKFVKESLRYQGPVEHERARKKNKAGESIGVNNKNIFVNPTRHCCFGYYHAANLSQDNHYHSHKRHQIPHFCWIFFPVKQTHTRWSLTWKLCFWDIPKWVGYYKRCGPNRSLRLL